MMTTRLMELGRMNLGDHRVRSIAWSESGDDLLVDLAPPKDPAEHLTLTFVWATGLEIKMSFGDYSGRPLVSDVSFGPQPSGDGYLVRMEFGGAPEGYIQLACNEVRVATG